MFEYYFYPEISKKLKRVSFDHGDLIFELNIAKKDLLLKSLSEDTKYKYSLKMKYNVYKNVIKHNFENRLLDTKIMRVNSFKSIRGFIMYMFNFDVFANTKYLSTMHYIRKNPLT
jgi:hypothetical protein